MFNPQKETHALYYEFDQEQGWKIAGPTAAVG